jgi:hypothetical protein
MKAVPLFQRRVVVASDAFVEIVVWRLDKPLLPSTHNLKYRLAYVVAGECVVLYDNERGKGDHRHFGTRQRPYEFSSADRLLADFDSDIARWNHENGRT